MAGLLGLNAAKYQYAVDQYQREHKVASFLKLSTVLLSKLKIKPKSVFCALCFWRDSFKFLRNQNTNLKNL